MPLRMWGQLIIQATAPAEPPVIVGTLWVDTAAGVVKQCTSVSPYTWVVAAAGGTVTSVGLTVPTGLQVSGSPVTGAGTLAIALAAGYVIPGGGTLGQLLQSKGASAPGFTTATYPETIPAGRLLFSTALDEIGSHDSIYADTTQMGVRDAGGESRFGAAFDSGSVADAAADFGWYMQRARGNRASPEIVQDGDRLGTWFFQGYDGLTHRPAASIHAEVEGTPGVDDMPAALVFSTRAVGGSVLVERMRIHPDGTITFTAGGSGVYVGAASPEGAVTAPQGSLYLRTNGLVYRKATGSGNTGWVDMANLASLTSSVANSAIAMTDASGVPSWTTGVEPIFTGSGNPQGVVTADPGRLYRNTATGRLYVNDGPAGNSTWRLYAPGFLDLDIQAWQAVNHNAPEFTFTNTRAQLTGIGTVNATQSGSNFYLTLTSPATTGQVASITPSYYAITNVSTNPDFQILIHTPASMASLRLWVGLASAAQADSDTLTGQGAGLRYSTVAGDAGWVPVTRGAGSQTVGAAISGGAPTVSTVYRIRIRTIDAGVTWRFSVNGGAEVTQTGTPPATNLGWQFSVHTQENVGKRIGFSRATLIRGAPVS